MFPFLFPSSLSLRFSMEKPLIDQCCSLTAQISSHPLFSVLTTFFLLNLLYLPSLLLPLLFSPVLITTSLTLTTLLHFASSRSPDTDPGDPNPIQLEDSSYKLPAAHVELHEQVKTSHIFCNNNFVEWAQKGGPLEVIHEEYEGEGGGDEGDAAPAYSGQSPEYSDSITCKRLDYHFGYCTSSTESDADSDESSENNVCFRWDEDEEGMIEIALEEDNLIEIDLSACR